MRKSLSTSRPIQFGEEWHKECFEASFAPNDCISKAEAKLRMKKEYVGFLDEENPPVSLNLNSEKNLKLIESSRLIDFTKALKVKNRTWLQQLSKEIRVELERVRLPAEYLAANGDPFTNENFDHNAFAYSSVQVMKVGQRSEAWHTDGGASLLHAGLTIFGSRILEVENGPASTFIAAAAPREFLCRQPVHPKSSCRARRRERGRL